MATWYRILVQSSHTSTSVVDDESDAKLIKQWWESSTGTDGGDRCIFASGDDYFNALLTVSGVPTPNEHALSQSVFGVASLLSNGWNGTATNAFPNIRDLFAEMPEQPAHDAADHAVRNRERFIVGIGAGHPWSADHEQRLH